MNLNRNNYEEFFLLYVDNELSAADRTAVELFVQQNADLKAELNMLQQTVFNADHVVFDNKQSLLKEEMTALQENLLLYIDGELNADNTMLVENLLQTDIAANKELALLRQTQLQADTSVVFANKKILYRKETRRVIDLPWRRIAAAAILLGVGVWATVSYLKNDKTTNGLVAVNPQPKTIAPPAISNTTAPVLQHDQQPASAEKSAIAKNSTVIEPATTKKNLTANNNTSRQTVQPNSEASTVIANTEIKKPDNNLPKPDYNNFNNNSRNETITANVTLRNAATEKINSGLNKAVVVSNNTTNNGEVSGYALNANYSEDITGNNLAPDDTKAKKTKLGGFLRRVKRLVDRNTNDESGNGVKIAGFDIAIK